MDRKKILLVAISAIGAFALLVWAYQKFNLGAETGMETSGLEETGALPETLEGVSKEIENQTTVDSTALEAEINAETVEIEKESALLNTLNQSYDESQL